VVSCSRALPVEPSPENPRPAQHHMLRAGDAEEPQGGGGYASTGDYIGVAFHGMATSHLDALCHVLVGGRMYNGFGAGEVRSTGARRCSVMVARDGIVSRGVLLDAPRARGVRWLEPRERIRRGELEAAERAGGAQIGEGDVLLISTGRDARRAALGPWDPLGVGLAGLHPDCIPWLHERRIALLGSDGVSDPLPWTASPAGRSRCTSAASSRWAFTCSTTWHSPSSRTPARRAGAASSCSSWLRSASRAERARR
jgi:hypothetical protein